MSARSFSAAQAAAGRPLLIGFPRPASSSSFVPSFLLTVPQAARTTTRTSPSASARTLPPPSPARLRSPRTTSRRCVAVSLLNDAFPPNLPLLRVPTAVLLLLLVLPVYTCAFCACRPWSSRAWASWTWSRPCTARTCTSAKPILPARPWVQSAKSARTPTAASPARRPTTKTVIASRRPRAHAPASTP